VNGVSTFQPVKPNGCVGILGGGQLGRMLALAAARLGLRAHIYCPEEKCPAAEVSSAYTVGAYTDEKNLAAFASSVDVITYEFENVPAQTVRILTALGRDVAPGGNALAIAQDRLKEKEFVQEVGGQTPLYHPVDDLASLAEGLQITGRPAILKTRHLGYDGKGQTRIGVKTDDLPRAWEGAIEYAWNEVGAKPSILEAFVPFEREISIIAARNRGGEVALYEPSENQHRDGILHRSVVPAAIGTQTHEAAQVLTTTMLEALDYVGVIGVEFFVMKDGSLLVNEFAPRVHNSGHWTEAICEISQFEQHIRAICGWPLGVPSRHSDGVMENLIGDEVNRWHDIIEEAGAVLNLYGKREARPGRKMGHVTQILPLS